LGQRPLNLGDSDAWGGVGREDMSPSSHVKQELLFLFLQNSYARTLFEILRIKYGHDMSSLVLPRWKTSPPARYSLGSTV